MRFLQWVTKNIVRSEKQGIIMADKSAIEAIHKLSVENDKLRAEVEMLRKRSEPVRKTYCVAGLYVSRPDGTVTRIGQSCTNCYK